MDSLTHIIFGAAVGELLLGKKAGNSAMLWGAIAATIPDLDVLTHAFADPVQANELHRGVTHSFLFSLVAAPVFGWWTVKHQRSFLAVFIALVAAVFVLGDGPFMVQVIVGAASIGLMALVFRRMDGSVSGTGKGWGWLFWWCMITHPLLDAQTAYGTQLFWPLPDKVAFNNMFVADPLFTLPLLVCFILGLFFKRHGRRHRIVLTGLVMSCAYVVLTFGMKWKAHHEVAASLKRQDFPAGPLVVRPAPLTSILWLWQADLPDEYRIGYYSLLDKKSDVEFVRIPKNHDLLGRWRQNKDVQRAIRMSDDSYVVRSENDTLVLCDLRFGQAGPPSTDARFIYQYKLIPEGDDLRVEFMPPPGFKGGGIGQAIKDLWTRLKGV